VLYSTACLEDHLPQPGATTHARYCCSMLAAVGSKEGAAMRMEADPWQVVNPCMGSGVGLNISTPPQRGGEGVTRR
jgi:hypothetical protein